MAIVATALLSAFMVGWQLFGPLPHLAGQSKAVQDAFVSAVSAGARPSLVRRRVAELSALVTSDAQRSARILAYAQALVQARELAAEVGIAIPSDALLAAIADVLQSGGRSAAVVRILRETHGEARIVALDTFYAHLRRGESSSTAVTAALR